MPLGLEPVLSIDSEFIFTQKSYKSNVCGFNFQNVLKLCDTEVNSKFGKFFYSLEEHWNTA